MSEKVIKNQPVAKFFYKGTHARPVRRTVLITETNGELFKGYEIREGNTIREMNEAPIKSFRKDSIATADQLRADNVLRKNLKDGESTLSRMSMKKLEEIGV